MSHSVDIKPRYVHSPDSRRLKICKTLGRYNVCFSAMEDDWAIIYDTFTKSLISPGRCHFVHPIMIGEYLVDKECTVISFGAYDNRSTKYGLQFMRHGKWGRIPHPDIPIFLWGVSGEYFVYAFSETDSEADAQFYVLDARTVLDRKVLYDPSSLGRKLCTGADLDPNISVLETIEINDAGIVKVFIHNFNDGAIYELVDRLIDIETGNIYMGQEDELIGDISPDGEFAEHIYNRDGGSSSYIGALSRTINSITLSDVTMPLPGRDQYCSKFWLLSEWDIEDETIGNPFIIFNGSDLFVANPINFEMITIQDFLKVAVNDITSDHPFEDGILIIESNDLDNPVFIHIGQLISMIAISL
jgi:hypothetical protein